MQHGLDFLLDLNIQKRWNDKMRQLASIKRIQEIKPIIGADKICSYRVDGWWVVDKKDQYNIGDLVVYLELDSWIPFELAPFLSKGKDPKEYNGVKGERLKTIRLKGSLSQGLILPLTVLSVNTDTGDYLGDWEQFEGHDVSERLGIQKWEPPIPAQLRGKIAGNFPSWARKTDQTRIQSCYGEVYPYFDEYWSVEEKMDGSSMTVAKRNDEVHVCSRNLSIKLDDDTNTFISVAKSTGIIDKICQYPRNVAISGELCGEGIQGNRYNIKGHRWFIFDIFDVDMQRYVSWEERQAIISDFAEMGVKLDQVPLVAVGPLTDMTVDSLLETAESKSKIDPETEQEGLVFKNIKNPEMSFKAISNLYLLETGN